MRQPIAISYHMQGKELNNNNSPLFFDFTFTFYNNIINNEFVIKLSIPYLELNKTPRNGNMNVQHLLFIIIIILILIYKFSLEDFLGPSLYVTYDALEVGTVSIIN